MKKYIFILFTLFCMLYLAPLKLRPLVSPDETRYAQISKEMIDSDNWTVPTLDGFRYFEKPVLGYWLNSISMKIFGMNNFGIRFAAALSAFITAILLFFMVRTLYDDRDSFYIALIYLSTTSVYLIGTTAILDSILNVFLTASCISFYFFLQAENTGKRCLFSILTGLSLALAFLTKGFLVFAVTGITAAAAVFWEIIRYRKSYITNESGDNTEQPQQQESDETGNLQLVKTILDTPDRRTVLHLTGYFLLMLIPVAAVTAPWVIQINKQAPDFWHYFIFEEHIKRFFSDKAQHAQPFFYYLLILPVLCMPWTLMLPFIIVRFRTLKEVITSHPLLRYAACWFIFPFIFFSISRGKLPTYILPCMPPMAVIFFALLKNAALKTALAGSEENDSSDNTELQFAPARNKIFNIMAIILLFVLLVATVLFAAAQYHGIPIKGEKFFIFDNKFEKTKVFSVLITSTMIILCLYKLSKLKAVYKKIMVMFIITALVYITILTSIPYVMIKHSKKVPGDFIRSYKNKINPLTVIAADHTLMTAACWFTGRDDVYLVISPGEINLNINKSQKSRFLKNKEAFKNFLKKNKHKDIIIFMTAKHYYKDVLKKEKILPPKEVHINGKLAALIYN